jgi:diguanylate cyclase (GGDEF)-like protein/PAS domain S-box-containing protein
MRPRLREPVALFLLIVAATLAVILLTLRSGGDALVPVLVALGLAAGIALLWERRIQHPMHRRLGTLQRRMQGFSLRDTPGAGSEAPGERDDPLSLGRMLAKRQRRFAAYTRRLRGEIARLNAIYAHSHDAILIFDPTDGRLLDCNPRALRMLGLAPEDRPAMRLEDLHDEDGAFLRNLVDEVMDQPGGRSLRLNYRAADGRTVPAEVSASRILLDGGRLLLCIARDVSERECAAQRIEHLAYHDTLTNLPNRILLTDRVNGALARARRTGQAGALLFLDLDKFKRINDSLGHSIGDELLKEIARRLQATLREEDTIARLGGDEFVVLLEGLGQGQEHAVAQARDIAEKVRTLFTEAFLLDGHELYVTASIGIVTFPQDGDSVDTLLRHADTAMYHAKGAGRDGARIFERRMDEAATSRLQYENELRIGLRQGQFELYFQPVLRIRDGSILGAEVLLRWHHPSAGLIAPSDFLPYIENSALMLKLDDWILQESCGLLGEIERDPELVAPECLAINISHQQFHQPDFVERVKQVVAQTGASPARLQFEITETVLIKDTRDSVERMKALKQIGIRFAIDDFGTGYSSLADLRQLPIDTIKIDRTFIRDIDSDPNDAAIVRAILSMAQHIGLEVIAEGVETRGQLSFLREAECACYQGYLGRPPIPQALFREELAYAGAYLAQDGSPRSTDGRDAKRHAGGRN